MLDEIRHIVESNPKNYVKVLKSKGLHKNVKSNEQLIDFIYEHTKQLDNTYTLKTRLYWLLNGIESWTDERVCCKICKKPLYDVNIAKLKDGYKPTCSKECERKLATKNIKKTMIKKYGVENAFLLESVHHDKVERLKNLVQQHPGSYIRKLTGKSYSSMYSDLQKLVLDSTPLLESEEYSFATRVFWTLHHITSFDDRRYCCSNCGKDIEHRNVKNVFAGYSKYCCKKCMHDSSSRKELYKEACMKHFGVENASQAQTVKDKKSATTMSNYGVSNPAKSHIVKDKTKKTNVERYGAKCSMQSELVKDKIRNTMLRRYGVEHPLQNNELRCKAQQKYAYEGTGFDSKPELALYIYLKSINADFKYQPDISYQYEAAGRKMMYFPDFMIDGKVYEIKGKHFFKEDGTMQNPWCHAQDEIYEAKHQCMIANNVTILLDDDKMIKDALAYVESNYGKNYLEQYRRTKK